jgi:hypothetical protein
MPVMMRDRRASVDKNRAKFSARLVNVGGRRAFASVDGDGTLIDPQRLIGGATVRLGV